MVLVFHTQLIDNIVAEIILVGQPEQGTYEYWIF